MARVPRVTTSAGRGDPIQAISQQLDHLLRVVDQQIEFGEPQNPMDPTSSVRAGSSSTDTHNGTISNLAVSWVEIELTSTGVSDATCRHNLYLSVPQYTVPVTGQPNCRWQVHAVMHDGTGKDGTSTLSVDVSWVGGTVNVNDILLRFVVAVGGTALTIDGDHPVLVTLCFTRATRGI